MGDLTQTVDRLSRRVEELESDAALVEWYFKQFSYEVNQKLEGRFALMDLSSNETAYYIRTDSGEHHGTAIAAIRKAKEMSDGNQADSI